ncbi:ABC1 kinase family protein [Salinigranum sp. GCM10025319]|uniref:ABC1 kinase family protein n=1 Tax=Salinigranum sp. GCM10025319 TaxID=3252687 RepID=UPI003613EEF0
MSRRTTAGVDRPTGLRITLRTYRRFVVVVWSFLPLLIAYARDARRFVLFGRSREVTERDRRRRAEYLLETFLDLGPTFIKVGQILSTRPDVLPRTYVQVLSRLQDRVPPDPWTEVEPLIREDVGPVDETFDEFDTDPISGASLGQVYTAVADGERVAVKVRRPGIVRRVEADLRVIGTLLPPIIRFAPPGQAFTMENLADEFEITIREELDYEHEAAMLTAVGENFADDPDVRIPRAIPAYSTERVLTMEYVDGTKINDLEAIDDMGLDREALVRRLEETYIEMIIEHGLFQADPHPGNIAVEADGTLVFYDFGVTGRLDAATQETLFDFYVAVAEDDIDAVIDAFVDLGALDPTVDREWMREVFELVFESLRGGGVEAYEVREIVSEFQGTLYEFPPPTAAEPRAHRSRLDRPGGRLPHPRRRLRLHRGRPRLRPRAGPHGTERPSGRRAVRRRRRGGRPRAPRRSRGVRSGPHRRRSRNRAARGRSHGSKRRARSPRGARGVGTAVRR